MLKRNVAVLLLALASPLYLTSGQAWAGPDQDKLVTTAEQSLDAFLRDPEMSWLQENIGKARAVLVAPQVVKAGFILGGSGGRAVLLYRNTKTGKWVGPAFYTLATGSVGFQAGVEVSELITLVMTENGVNKLLSSSFKLGGDASVAAGPVGVGAKSNVQADFISYTRSKGLYGGLNLDGTAVTVSDEWNAAYYGKNVAPPDILVRQNVSNAQAQKLRDRLAKAIGGK